MHDPPDANLLRSEQRDVTLLFADLRGFTKLAASLATDPLVCELLAHVMECLSDAVAKHDGYIVDYYGDGLAAMWNAPSDQPDHAALACHAGLQMLRSLPDISAEWRNVTHAELRLGIGVHSGAVQVGNAGSSRKAKYGPRGPNVNLASRVESATKELGVSFVVTGATARQLPDQFTTHRVCRAQMSGFDQPVDLYAIELANADSRSVSAWATYGEALGQYERGNLDAAAGALDAMDASSADVPWRFLYERVQNDLNGQLRRRSTDKPTTTSNGGVMLLSSK